jgi:N-acetyl-anhydromuramyl-L-alanine amidase AmpD
MSMSTTKIQEALLKLGYDVGRAGADGKMGQDTEEAVRAFQHAVGLYVDGKPGKLTQEALLGLVEEAPALPAGGAIPASWMPKCDMDRIIVHWTAGHHQASSGDREHYHILWEGDGTAVRGVPTIDKNVASGARAGYAAHTLNCNTGSIGVSMCCMASAVESPFSPGPAPMTRAQWDAMVSGVAQLCTRYGIPVTPRTVLSHAEVQGTLGIRQRQKWDVSRLAFDKSVVGATACGNLLRRQVAALL